MSSKRGILLEALDVWRAEGILGDDQWRLLRSRVETEASDASLAAPASAGTPSAERRSFASDAMQFVGGLLLGAALVALLAFLDPGEDVVRWSLLVLGILGLAGAAFALLHLSAERVGLVEAAFAAALVPLGVAAAMAIGAEDPLAGFLATIAGVATHLVKRGSGASVALAAVVVSMGSFAMVGFDDVFGDSGSGVDEMLWLVALLGYLALTLVWRRGWSSVASGGLVIPLVIAFLMTLDAFSDSSNSVMMELLVGAFLGALLGVGLWLGSRGLVAGAGAGLTIDAVVFAFDVGGPGTAVVLLLALGGLLVWQAEVLRRFFRASS